MENHGIYGTRAETLKRVGRMAQLASIRRYALEDGKGRGMRALEVANGGGLAFTVYPDKGLDIGEASLNGRALAWCTPNGPVAPAFYDPAGLEWLRTWNGGLLTSCGILNVGGPCSTPEGDHGLHGRLHHTPAEEVNTRALWQEDGRYLLEISGTITQSRVFCEKLATRRTIRTWLGTNAIEITDRAENLGSASLPFMRLYHMNLGYPLVDDAAVLVAPDHPVTPQNPYSAEHLADWPRFAAPVRGFAEQVFYHDLPADADGFAALTLRNPANGLALTVSYRKRELPWLVQWKMHGEGEYVTGLEPANCWPDGQTANAARGQLRHIEPGETIETVVRVAACLG